jgi:hypothetical protein
MGPFPRAIGQYRYLYIAIDKFTKWPKATPVVKINKQFVVKFIKSIANRFGVPNKSITDNRPQFTSGAFQGYCEDQGFKYAMRVLLIQRAMTKLKELMQKSSRVSRHVFTMA